MPKSVNEVRIAGHAGRDAERRGNGPYKFSVATGGGTNKEKTKEYPTQWHTIVVWPQRIDGAELVKKGTFVDVTGRLEYEKWTGKDGIEKTQAVIVATALDIPEREPHQRPLTPQPVSQPKQYAPMGKSLEIDDGDEIPF